MSAGGKSATVTGADLPRIAAKLIGRLLPATTAPERAARLASLHECVRAITATR